MWYIIFIIAIILAIVKLGKPILFSPQINSAISIPLIVWVMITENVSFVMLLLLVVSIIDCIRDIKIAQWRYENIEYGIDPLYLKKSLTSIFTMGLSRAIFLIVECACVYSWLSKDIRTKMSFGYPLGVYGSYKRNMRFETPKRYYYNQCLYSLYEKGKIISNDETRHKEYEISKNKLMASNVELRKETKKYLKEMKISRKKHPRLYADLAAREEISEFTQAYLSAEFYKKYPQRIAEVMLTKGTVSPETIKEFEELKDLNLTMLLEDDNSWSVPFIIEALNDLVEQGTVEDLNLSDEIEINHTYRHVESKVKMKSVDLSSLLDDDDL